MRKIINVLAVFMAFSLFTFATSCSDDDDIVAAKAIELDTSIKDGIKVRAGSNYDVRPKVTILPANVTSSAVRYTSSDNSIATISGAGFITGVKIGEATITVTSANNEEATTSFKIKVVTSVIEPTSIEIDPSIKDGVILDIGGVLDIQVNISVKPDNAEDKTVTYTPTNPAIIKVENGVITALSSGETTITIASSYDPSINTTLKVTVTTIQFIRVESITLDATIKDGITLDINDVLNISSKVTVLPANATDKSVKYTSSDVAAVSIDENGVITALNSGDAIITVTSIDKEEIKATFNIKVNPKYFDRSGWTATSSHTAVMEGVIGSAKDILDGVTTTFLSMVKPDKEYGGISTPANEWLSFIVDMKAKKKFNAFKWEHRSGNPNNYLRYWGIDVLGSNDGVNFTVIKAGIDLDYSSDKAVNEISIPESDYQYIKVVCVKWSDNTTGGSKSGGTVQVSEFIVGHEKAKQ